MCPSSNAPPDPFTPPETAIPELLEAHGDRIFALGRRLCDRPEDAEDLVQETFLRAFRAWGSFEGRSDPSTWLYTIAVRACRRMRRRSRRAMGAAPSLSQLLPSGDDPVPHIPSGDRSPLDEMLLDELRETVQGAIARLPWHYRLPLVLKDLAGLSIAEVARVLGIKEATVKTRLHRARLIIREELTEHLPKRHAPPPDHARRICLDLLQAKQEALDRGAPFPVPRDELCSRCASMFETLDMTRDVCRDLAAGHLPDEIRRTLLEEMQQDHGSDR